MSGSIPCTDSLLLAAWGDMFGILYVYYGNSAYTGNPVCLSVRHFLYCFENVMQYIPSDCTIFFVPNIIIEISYLFILLYRIK